MNTTQRFYNVYIQKDGAFDIGFVRSRIRSAIIESYPEQYSSTPGIFQMMFLPRVVENGGPGRYIITVPMRLNLGAGQAAPGMNPDVPGLINENGYSMWFADTVDPMSQNVVGPVPWQQPPIAVPAGSAAAAGGRRRRRKTRKQRRRMSRRRVR